MNSITRKIVDSLRTRIDGVNLDDVSALSHIVNGVAEDLKLTEGKASILQVAVAEGVLPLIRGVAGQPDVKGQLSSIAAALMAKRHLSRRSARYAVRVWAAALDVLPSPAIAENPAPSGGWAILKRIPWPVIVVAMIAIVGLGVYFRREIGHFLGVVFTGLLGLAFMYVVKEILCAVFSWPARKLAEGLAQIKYGLDWIPGSVYILAILTLGFADWLGVFPYGMRDVAAFVQEAERNGNIHPAAEGDKIPPNPATKNAGQLPARQATDAAEPTTTKPVGIRVMPVEAPTNATQVQQSASVSGESVRKVPRANPEGRLPTPIASEIANSEKVSPVPLSVSASGRQTSFAPTLNTEARSTHVLEFYLPQHGNDALRVTVQGDIYVGSVVVATFRGRKLRLQVLRPLGTANGYGDTQRWLAVPVPERRETMVGTTP